MYSHTRTNNNFSLLTRHIWTLWQQAIIGLPELKRGATILLGLHLIVKHVFPVIYVIFEEMKKREPTFGPYGHLSLFVCRNWYLVSILKVFLGTQYGK